MGRPYSVLHPVGFTVPALLPGPRCALAAPFRPYPSEAGRYAFCGTVPEEPSPKLMILRRALPGTVVPWSPDFPRWSKLPRGRPALWLRQYGLLRPWQQQREELCPALAVDDPVDEVGPEAALEGDHRLLRVRHIIAEPLER